MLLQIARTVRNQCGQSAVEFALVIPILMVILLSIIDLGQILHQQLIVTEAAREGARAVAVSGDRTQAVTVAQRYNSGYTVSSLPASWTRGTLLTVQVSSNVITIDPLIGAFFSGNTLTVTGTANMSAETANTN